MNVESNSNHTVLDFDLLSNPDRLAKLVLPMFKSDDVPIFGNLTSSVLAYVQWTSATSADDAQADYYFRQIMGDFAITKFASPMPPANDGKAYVPVSKLMAGWVFTGVREHLFPFMKRTYSTTLTNYNTSGYADTVARRIDNIIQDHDNTGGCYVSVQIMPVGDWGGGVESLQGGLRHAGEARRAGRHRRQPCNDGRPCTTHPHATLPPPPPSNDSTAAPTAPSASSPTRTRRTVGATLKSGPRWSSSTTRITPRPSRRARRGSPRTTSTSRAARARPRSRWRTGAGTGARTRARTWAR